MNSALRAFIKNVLHIRQQRIHIKLFNKNELSVSIRLKSRKYSYSSRSAENIYLFNASVVEEPKMFIS